MEERKQARMANPELGLDIRDAFKYAEKAAEQPSLHPSQLYGWRSRKQQAQTRSEREQSLSDENARLKRLLAEQAEELAIVKRLPRTLPGASSEVRLHMGTCAPVPSKSHVSRAGHRP